MEIIHHICYWDSWSRSLRPELESARIKLKENRSPDGKDTFIAFDLPESHPFWKEMSRRVRGVKGWIIYSDSYDTYFSDEEILNSEWSRVYAENVKKYPAPYSTWVTDPINYDDFCRNCGTHVQARPFRISKEPAWGHYDFFTFFWGHPLFCSSRVIEEFVKKDVKGLHRMDLLINKTSEPVRDIFQILPANLTGGGLIAARNKKGSSCRKCGNHKYGYHNLNRMQYRRDSIPDGVDILFTQEWIGAGRKDAWRDILVSRKATGIILENGWKGLRFSAIELV